MMSVVQPLAFVWDIVIGTASGWCFARLTKSKSDLTLDVLFGIAGAIVGGVIASFPEFSALGTYRGLMGALIGSIFVPARLASDDALCPIDRPKYWASGSLTTSRGWPSHDVPPSLPMWRSRRETASSRSPARNERSSTKSSPVGMVVRQDQALHAATKTRSSTECIRAKPLRNAGWCRTCCGNPVC